MNRQHRLFPLAVVIAFLAAAPIAAAQGQPGDKTAGPRPIGLQDILAWKSIGSAELSPDGSWFMYVLSPVEGDSEMVLRQVAGDKEHRFPIFRPTPSGPPSSPILPPRR